MMIVSPEQLDGFREYLLSEEKSAATVRKYVYDVTVFFRFADGQPPTKELLIAYKKHLLERYAVGSVNTMLISLNCFFTWLGVPELRLRTVKCQRQIFRSDRELTEKEYKRLLRAAERRGDTRLRLLMETICATGIRVSELRSITVEAVRKGVAEVTNKGKRRQVLLPDAVRKRLKDYCRSRKIESGPVFITRTGAAMDRGNIWAAMKRLCREAGVAAGKVFPHNLRHLFARMFLRIEKDISKLADVLGHANLNTTRIYTVSSGAEHLARINKLSTVLLL